MRLYNLVWPIPHNLRTFAAINQFFSSSAPVGATFKQATDSKVAKEDREDGVTIRDAIGSWWCSKKMETIAKW